jgi:hypothetical protein
MRLRAMPLLMLCVLCDPAWAQSVVWHGAVDLRAASPGDEWNWNRGGLGKTRFGGDGNDHAVDGALAASLQLTPSLLASAEIQYQSEQRHPLGVLDAFLRYRPVSTTPWRWTTTVGVFFPPISLENTGVGWTSPWTLTPSAINTWVGEELRTVGSEVRLAHRADSNTFELIGAVFGKNDPAGELMAARGWALDDLTSGLNASVREPNVYGSLIGAQGTIWYQPFVEIDHRIGWYAGANWSAPAYGTLSVLRYDNRADPSVYQEYDDRDVFAWHTRFWSVGGRTQIGEVTLLAQAMHGATAIEPQPSLYLDTRFNAGYILAGWEHGNWQPAVRVDWFQTRQSPELPSALLSEHGHAATAALNWRPTRNVRVTGEWLRVDSIRNERLLAGQSARQLQTHVQLSVRLQF